MTYGTLALVEDRLAGHDERVRLRLEHDAARDEQAGLELLVVLDRDADRHRARRGVDDGRDDRHDRRRRSHPGQASLLISTGEARPHERQVALGDLRVHDERGRIEDLEQRAARERREERLLALRGLALGHDARRSGPGASPTRRLRSARATVRAPCPAASSRARRSPADLLDLDLDPLGRSRSPGRACTGTCRATPARWRPSRPGPSPRSSVLLGLLER